MTQPGPLDRIATALETIATALTGTTPAAHTPRHPAPDPAQFAWEPDTERPAAALPEPEPAEERCGFLIEQYVHPLDRTTLIYQISKSGASLLLNAQEATRLAGLDDDEFTTAMAARLAEVLAQRHRETRAAAPASEPAVMAAGLAPDVDDEEREREWARRETADAS
jgi:hypothetical protein